MALENFPEFIDRILFYFGLLSSKHSATILEEKWHCSGRKSRLWSMITKYIVKWKITMIKVITISFLPPTFCHPLHYKWNVENLKPRGSGRLTEKWNSTVSFHEVVFYYGVEHLPCCIYFGITHNLVENSSLIFCKYHNNFIGSSSCILLESLCYWQSFIHDK